MPTDTKSRPIEAIRWQALRLWLESQVSGPIDSRMRVVSQQRQHQARRALDVMSQLESTLTES